ncbi:MAG: 6,7-dimethyl-8-ribityllumazine synthase [Burkholderiales bacterium]|nr:6,7-dimethyl-8-ribityllumazine synthase [Burkholderiales bacterium]
MSDDRVRFDEGLSGRGLRIGVVQARFNATIGDRLRSGCIDELTRLGVADDDIEVVTVPGALEIPLALKLLAESDEFDVLVAIGCVIRGETYHFELVCNEAAAGITRVQLDALMPVANAVLTVENLAQAEARIGKGAEAARVAVEMALLADSLG